MNLAIYIILLVVGFFTLKKEIKTDFNNLNKTNAMSVLGMCTVGIIVAYIGNYIGSIVSIMFGGDDNSANQEAIEMIMFSKYGIFMCIATMFIGPIVEELVFRKGIYSLFSFVLL